MPFVTAIFINYRTAALTIDAVDALRTELEALGEHRIIVVDNNSGDGSFDELTRAVTERSWGERVVVLAAPRNGGYGYGINLAVRHAQATIPATDYFYVLNTDAFVEPGTLQRLVTFMDSHPDAGLLGSQVRDPNGVTQGGAFRFPSILSELEQMAAFSVVSRVLRPYAVVRPLPATDQEVDWLPGTGMLIRRAVFEGGLFFDETFFLYFEEVDFARQVRAAGWRAYFVADAPIKHIGSVSTGLGELERRLPDYWFDSRHRYFRKHHPAAYAAAADAAWVAGYLIFRAKRLALRQSRARRPYLLRDFLRGSGRELLRALRGTSTDGPEGDGHEGDEHEGHEHEGHEHEADAIGLVELVLEDFATCGRDALDPGFWAVFVHRLARRARAVRTAPVRGALERGLGALSVGIDWLWGIQLPASVELGRRVRLRHEGGGMLLHARAIGADVTICHDTTFGPLRAGERGEDALPTIEDGVELGPGVSVLGPVTVGRRAVVLANSVVLRDVDPAATVVGVPSHRSEPPQETAG